MGNNGLFQSPGPWTPVLHERLFGSWSMCSTVWLEMLTIMEMPTNRTHLGPTGTQSRRVVTNHNSVLGTVTWVCREGGPITSLVLLLRSTKDPDLQSEEIPDYRQVICIWTGTPAGCFTKGLCDGCPMRAALFAANLQIFRVCILPPPWDSEAHAV